jgi:hypothetical protein
MDIKNIKSHIELIEKEVKSSEVNYHRLCGALAILKVLVNEEENESKPSDTTTI